MDMISDRFLNNMIEWSGNMDLTTAVLKVKLLEVSLKKANDLIEDYKTIAHEMSKQVAEYQDQVSLLIGNIKRLESDMAVALERNEALEVELRERRAAEKPKECTCPRCSGFDDEAYYQE